MVGVKGAGVRGAGSVGWRAGCWRGVGYSSSAAAKREGTARRGAVPSGSAVRFGGLVADAIRHPLIIGRQTHTERIGRVNAYVGRARDGHPRIYRVTVGARRL